MSGSYRKAHTTGSRRRTVPSAVPLKDLDYGRPNHLATCPDCGKRGYISKRAAKQAAGVLYPGTRMRVYRCGDMWHMTSFDAAAIASLRERQTGTATRGTP
jgi:hypothetical protein